VRDDLRGVEGADPAGLDEAEVEVEVEVEIELDLPEDEVEERLEDSDFLCAAE